MTLFAGSIGVNSSKFINHLLNTVDGLNNAKTVLNSDFSFLGGREYTCLSKQSYFLALVGNSYKEVELESILDKYKQGKNFLDLLNVGFGIVLVDYEKRKITLALDPIGQKNIYYAQSGNELIFASSADLVIAHPEVSNELSKQSIYNYIYFHQCPSPDTIYQQVKKLEGGQVLTYQNGKIQTNYYWIPKFSEKLDVSLHDAEEELKKKIVNAVRQSVDDIDKAGAFLSGGLDSSSVAGALSMAYPGKARSFSMGFDVAGYDEIEYARIATKQFNLDQFEYYVTPADTVEAIPKIASYYDEPFGNSSALATYYCAKLAKENGVSVLLAGDGGDELFAGNERYRKQLLFEKYYQIPRFIRTPLKNSLYALPEFIYKNKLFFKAKRYVEQAEIILPDRLQDYNFLHRHSLNDIFSDNFILEVDPTFPLQSLRDSYNRPENASELNRMLYMDWKTTLHDNDLVKVNRMCEMMGVEVKYPLLNREMVDFSCGIPSKLKIKNGQLRWFYKKAMEDFLPHEIIHKSKHGFGLPFGIWLKEYQPLKELAYDSINSLKKRSLFRSEFLENVIDMHQNIHAAYYGELIWILMMLELWFSNKEFKF